MARRRGTPSQKRAETYQHPEADSAMRPEVGTQAQFKKKKAPKTYRYDSSLSPALDWDTNPAREQGEELIARILDAESIEDAKAAAAELRALGKPFLDWAGKAERLSFDVPTLPLFVHERLSTKAILETLKRHKKDQQVDFFDLFGDPQHSIADQVLKAYEYRDEWVNRMILGDSLVVMNSLLHYEGLGGQVQMIYIDPPYGVKFGSNFQPFVRKRDVKHNDDDHMTREPEMVQAYRDTWELGLHSYLTYLRDRLLVARELLTPSGSVFVQISDENLHHVREVMDEVFGAENFGRVISFKKTAGDTSRILPAMGDYVLWYFRDEPRAKYRDLFVGKELGVGSGGFYTWLESPRGEIRNLTSEERNRPDLIPEGARPFAAADLKRDGFSPTATFEYEFDGRTFHPGRTKQWKTNRAGMDRLAATNLLFPVGDILRYKRYLSDFPITKLGNLWTDTESGSFTRDKVYVVQTTAKVIQRCLLMTTDPGDLVLDPTCGSGTTAYVAEQWGRRWITVDTSRVPLALARQRLLTATYPWYELKEEARGPGGGFVYKRKQNRKGEEVGGIVPHVTLKSIANDEPPAEEILVDRPEEEKSITRVTGPFCFEATIPTPVDWEGDGEEDSGAITTDEYASYVDRMLEVLRKAPLLRVLGNQTVQLRNVRSPAKTLTLSAEAMVNGGAAPERPVAIVFGPENGAVSEKLVYEAGREAHAKSYTHLYVIGFAIQPNARDLIEKSEAVVGVPATYVQATPDLLMGDLLKNMRSSQVFSVCALPDVKVTRAKRTEPDDPERFQVELLGLDTFDAATMEVEHQKGDDVPCWLLDTDYNDRCFRVCQAFFPRTGAWTAIKKALKADYDETVWDHLAGTTSAPFAAGGERRVAVKVIDDRGNELLVVKSIDEATA